MVQKSVIEQLDALPPEAQQQVLDFIAFLRTRYQPVAQKSTKTETGMLNEKFVGMWSDRGDLSNSSTWVRETRTKEWGTGS
jgi:hypothetical protein